MLITIMFYSEIDTVFSQLIWIIYVPKIILRLSELGICGRVKSMLDSIFAVPENKYSLFSLLPLTSMDLSKYIYSKQVLYLEITTFVLLFHFAVFHITGEVGVPTAD